MKFIETTPLTTLARIFPGFMNFALSAPAPEDSHSALRGPSATENSERLLHVQDTFDELLAQNATIKEFCHAAALGINDFLGRINQGFQSWLETEISVEEFAKLQRSHGASLLLVDVREDWEREIVTLEGSIKFTQENAENILQAASSAAFVIIYCHHGIRSLYAASYFKENGVPQARSLKGGIDAYTLHIDNSLSRY